MKIENAYLGGRAMYLAGLAILGFVNFLLHEFAMTRPKSWPAGLMDMTQPIAYLGGSLLIVTVVLIFMNKWQKTSLVVIALLIFLLATSRHILALWEDKVNSYKSVVLICGALLIYYSLIESVPVKKFLRWFCLIMVCLFFAYCAIGHLVAAKYVQLLIPDYIPYRLFFTYFAGVCLALASLGLLITPLQKITALLSGIQITAWFILLHIPRAITIGGETWIGVGESLALAGVCFMIYGIVK